MILTPVSSANSFRNDVFQCKPNVEFSTTQPPPANLKYFKLSLTAFSHSKSFIFRLSLWEYLGESLKEKNMYIKVVRSS